MLTSSTCIGSSAYKTAARIDIHCEIQAVPFAQLSQMKPGEPSAVIRERVIKARNIQTERFSSLPTGEGGGRGHILKVAHTIAEAIGYRNLDRGDWAERASSGIAVGTDT